MKRSPFKFLDAYTKKDYNIFFGREEETRKLYDALSGVKHLLVYGPSGAGKTSLVECGLRNEFSNADWFALTIRKGSNINASVFKGINKYLKKKEGIDEATGFPVNKEIGFEHVVERLFKERYKPVYLLFDQFEELLISGNKEEQKIFFENLNQLIRYRVPCRVLLIMREEFIGHLSEFERLCPTIFQNRFRLERMRISSVKEVITKTLSASKFASSFTVNNTNALADTILKKLPDQVKQIELTHVQVFLSELWDRANKKLEHSKTKNQATLPVLDQSLIQAEDNLTSILDSFLKKQLENMDTDYSEHFPLEVLATMISDRNTKLQLSEQDIKTELTERKIKFPPTLNGILSDFKTRRILREIKSNNETQYEISHDILARVIGDSLTEEMKDRQKAQDLEKFYEDTTHNFSEAELKKLERYEKYYQPDLQQRIQKSRKSLRRRRRQLIGLVTLVIASLSVLTLFAFNEQRNAKEQENIAKQKSKELAASLNKLEKETADKIKALADRQSIEFEDLKTRANTILRGGGCPVPLLKEMDAIAQINPDSIRYITIIKEIKQSQNCK